MTTIATSTTPPIPSSFQIVKQSAATSVQPTVMASAHSSPSVPASASAIASVPVQQSSPSQTSSVVNSNGVSAINSNSVSSSPQASATFQATSGSSPHSSPQTAATVQQVVPSYTLLYTEASVLILSSGGAFVHSRGRAGPVLKVRRGRAMWCLIGVVAVAAASQCVVLSPSFVCAHCVPYPYLHHSAQVVASNFQSVARQ